MDETRRNVRLALLQLVYSHAFKAEEVIGKARKLEEYIFESGEQPAVLPVSAPSRATPVVKAAAAIAGGKKGKSDNAEIFK